MKFDKHKNDLNKTWQMIRETIQKDNMTAKPATCSKDWTMFSGKWLGVGKFICAEVISSPKSCGPSHSVHCLSRTISLYVSVTEWFRSSVIIYGLSLQYCSVVEPIHL